jgi:hypothetical protein
MEGTVLDRFSFDAAAGALTSGDGADHWRLLDAIPNRQAAEDRL